MDRMLKTDFWQRGVPALGLVFAVLLGGGASSAVAQSSDLPSSPQANPSSLANPFYGSVTLHPATDEVLRLSLDDAVNRGFQTNLGLKESEQGEQSLHSQKLEAMQLFLPSITVTGGPEVHQYNLAALGFGPSLLAKAAPLFPEFNFADLSLITKADVVTGQVNYEQTLFSGPVFSGYRAVTAAEQVAYYAKMSARGEVVQQVATAYLAVIAAQSEVDNAKSLLEADKVLADQAHDKHLAGTIPNLDEIRARVQYQQQEQVMLADENKLDKSLILLKREIGVAPGQKITLTDPAPYSDLAALTHEELRAEAYDNRQDYQNLQAQERELAMVLSARRQERLPTLTFKGNYGVTGVTGDGYHGTMSAVGTLKVPVFQEGTLRGDRDVARAQLAATNLQLGDLRNKIDQQVRSVLMDVHADRQLVDVARSNVDLAGSALSDEMDRFKSGIDDTLPLVQAQASLASAQSNLVQSLYQYNVSKLLLARTAGVLEQQYKTYLGK
ncbi:TolC family protein [Acidicapsa ligni]|uniref:TolC family protein n=1 Tax=Acidicapsa ligni TaxID=542300 RepID=UPI0021DFE788|nr:TolC family protein [Acidicapsa ligni]